VDTAAARIELIGAPPQRLHLRHETNTHRITTGIRPFSSAHLAKSHVIR